MGRDLKPGHVVRISFYLQQLDEYIRKTGPVRYDVEKDQFFLEDHPLEIYDDFVILDYEREEDKLFRTIHPRDSV